MDTVTAQSAQLQILPSVGGRNGESVMDNVGNCPIGNNDEQIKNRIDITAAVPATDIVLTAHGNDLAIHPSTVQQNMMGLIISDESSDGGDNNNNSTISSNDSNTAATKISTFGLEDNNEKSVVVVMSEIIKSPYEIGACAEIGEYYFDELKNIMKPTTTTRAVLPHDDDDIISSDHTMIIIMNPKMENFFGDTLARALFKARLEIVKSGMVFSTSWREGKIRGNNFGWIPRKQVLLCLQEQLFVEANVTSLQAIVKNLDCVDLVLEAITTYNLTYEYPNLSSNKKERAFFFDTPETTKICCYKCVIFVARAFATLQILRKAHEINQSLTKNMKKCLSIINKHVRTNPKKVTELKHKSEQYFNSNNNNNNNNSKPNSKASKLKQCDQISKRRRSSVTASITSNRNRVDDEEAISATATSRRPCKKIRQSVVKSESLLLSFKIMQEQTQRISQTMDFFKTQLQDHRDILRGEIRDSIKKEDKASSGGNSSGR